MLGSPAGPGGPTQRGLWPLAPAPIPSATNFAADGGYSKYGLYSFLPGSPTFGSALYSHSSPIGRFATGSIQPTPGTAFHAAHKVTDSLFASTGYTFGAPTPPPGSPYSPVPVTQLEVLTKGFNSNIIIQQPEYTQASKKFVAETSKHNEELIVKCCKKSCCSCSPVKTKFIDASSGCSRTNPLDWNLVSIKKEPGACQVAEVTTSDTPNINATIKVEAASPTQQKTCVSSIYHHQQIQQQPSSQIHHTSSVVTSNGNIPIGIAVARQRIQQHHEVVTSPSLPTISAHTGLLTTVNATHIKDIARISELDAGMAASSGAAGVAGGGALLQCPPDDRNGGFASWPVGGAHNSALATPTLWQYPAHLPMEPLLPMSVPMPPVGFQLVRDHNTGGFLLLPTTGVEQLQQVVWPSYHQPSSHVLLPPSLPPPPLQLLSSSSDYLQTSTTLHQHTQSHSTRLLAVTTDKRKLPMPIPTTTLIKIESELDQSKALQAVSAFGNNTGTVYSDPTMGPMVTTHLIYQHPTNLILSQTPAPTDTTTLTTATCRSQATSPVACLTPPPEHAPDFDDEEETSVQDASNQTDAQECELPDDEHTNTSKDEVQNFPTSEPSICVPESCPQEHEIVPNRFGVPEMTIALAQSDPPPDEVQTEHFELQPHAVPVHERDEAIRLETLSQVMDLSKRHDNATLEHGDENDLRDVVQLPPTPDLSGLELLSNSIAEFENSHKTEAIDVSSATAARCTKTNDEVLEGIAQMTIADKPMHAIMKDEDLGGLNLLCALAEQRFKEEVTSGIKRNQERKVHFKSDHRKPEKRKADSNLVPECETKKKHLKTSDIQSDDKKRDNSIKSCTCKEDSYRTYKTKESEEEAKKFLASKSQTICCNSDWPCMNAMELDMRMRLADLQRKYREKQKELSKLKPKRQEYRERHGDKKSHHQRSRKKSINSDRSTPPPPLLDKMDTPAAIKNSHSKCLELLKPPTLCPYGSQDNNNVNPIRGHQRIDESPQSDRSFKSSKKRKVGRPKKLMATTGFQSSTETIVAKKPKKGNLVGYLLAAKEKLLRNNSVFSDPPRFIEDSDCHRHEKKRRSKIRPTLKAEATLKHPDDEDNDYGSEEMEEECDEGIEDREEDYKPEEEEEVEVEEEERKKCETDNEKAKQYLTESENEVEKEEDEKEEEEEERDEESVESEEQSQVDVEEDEDEEDRPDEDVEVENNDNEPITENNNKHDIASVHVEDEPEEDEPEDGEEATIEEERAKIDCRCTLTTEHLEVDKLRVLTAMGGLFYAGRLNAVQPPDVYSITLDGERGNRPHIMSREEIQRDAIVEVSPVNTDELPPGTRLCAYWSQQYRCLYPGSVAEPESPNPELDSKFVSVEFDDGDSGRIAIEDIRLLPVDYPIIEYDPNPLLSLCKKRRRASTIDERRSTASNKSPIPVGTQSVASQTAHCPRKAPAPLPPPPPPPQQQQPKAEIVTKSEKENLDVNKQLQSHKERKKLKKKKRDKLKHKLHDEKKKKRKHKCTEENCKHRKHHKKHRKHKKHHHHHKHAHEPSPKKKKHEQHMEIIAEDEEPNEPDEEIEEEMEEMEVAHTPEPEIHYPEYHIVANPEDEVTMDDILEAKTEKTKKFRDRQESCESRSKMSAFLPARQLWGWSGKGYKRPKTKGRSRKQFYRAIQRGKETIQVGDSAVFLSTGRPDRPYIGKIEAMWESCGTMVVKVKWFYHPEETVGCPLSLKYPGALFESPHVDENDVQTISHKCEVLPLKDYTDKLGDDPKRYATIYDNNDIYYLGGYYDPTSTTLKMEPEIPFNKTDDD